MANHSSGGRGRAVRAAKRAGTPAFTEPEVRRWPHPVDGVAPSSPRQAVPAMQTDPALYYIHCALSYQNQLLADIKSLLEQLAADRETAEEES